MREGTQVYLWLINDDVWQKPTQFCKAIILQSKNKFKIKKNFFNLEDDGKNKGEYFHHLWGSEIVKFYRQLGDHKLMFKFEFINGNFHMTGW